MILTDAANASFELGGAVFLLKNLKALHRDKRLRGVSVLPTAFFTAWGFFNALVYYPALHQWLSFSAGLAVTSVNLAWMGMALYYRRLEQKGTDR